MGVLMTEHEFTLPLGYADSEGNLHKKGVMRLATAADEILPIVVVGSKYFVWTRRINYRFALVQPVSELIAPDIERYLPVIQIWALPIRDAWITDQCLQSLRFRWVLSSIDLKHIAGCFERSDHRPRATHLRLTMNVSVHSEQKEDHD